MRNYTTLTDSDTIKICWYWPDTDTDTRIGAALMRIIGGFYGCKWKRTPKCDFYYPGVKLTILVFGNLLMKFLAVIQVKHLTEQLLCPIYLASHS